MRAATPQQNALKYAQKMISSARRAHPQQKKKWKTECFHFDIFLLRPAYIPILHIVRWAPENLKVHASMHGKYKNLEDVCKPQTTVFFKVYSAWPLLVELLLNKKPNKICSKMISDALKKKRKNRVFSFWYLPSEAYTLWTHRQGGTWKCQA